MNTHPSPPVMTNVKNEKIHTSISFQLSSHATNIQSTTNGCSNGANTNVRTPSQISTDLHKITRTSSNDIIAPQNEAFHVPRRCTAQKSAYQSQKQLSFLHQISYRARHYSSRKPLDPTITSIDEDKSTITTCTNKNECSPENKLTRIDRPLTSSTATENIVLPPIKSALSAITQNSKVFPRYSLFLSSSSIPESNEYWGDKMDTKPTGTLRVYYQNIHGLFHNNSWDKCKQIIDMINKNEINVAGFTETNLKLNYHRTQYIHTLLCKRNRNSILITSSSDEHTRQSFQPGGTSMIL